MPKRRLLGQLSPSYLLLVGGAIAVLLAFNPDVAPMNEHALSPYFGAMRSEASRRTTSPLRYGLSIMCIASKANSSG